ncbi:MAG: hypothetical protein ACLTER_04665 [Ruminococcus sp.]
MPVLSVVIGILRGYVPFDKDWTGFSAREEYREASESVMQRRTRENTAKVIEPTESIGI